MNTKNFVMVASLAVALAGAAQAERVGYLGPEGTGIKVNVVTSGGLTLANGNEAGSIYAGKLLHSVGDAIRETYCTELHQPAGPRKGQANFDEVPLADAPVPAPAMGTYRAGAIDALLMATGHGAKGKSGAISDVEAAAFQALIWEIVHEGYDDKGDLIKSDAQLRAAIDLEDGRTKFEATNARHRTAFNKAFAYFKNLAFADNRVRSENRTALVNADRQDQIVIIPLPGTGVLATAGLAGLAVRRRRA